MKILIVNPIVYTSETARIKRADSIKDTMIYSLCLAFLRRGAQVTLIAGEDFKPALSEEYPFRVVWAKCVCKRLFKPNALPFCPQVLRLVNKEPFDLIISSEVFSMNSLMLALKAPEKLIVWHELAKHNRIFHGAASRLWYGIVARLCFSRALVVARSEQARAFIGRYCKNVSAAVIDHGIDLEKFTVSTQKENYFAVTAQLIPRKRVDRTVKKFAEYLKKYDASCRLYIMGDGPEKERLLQLAESLGVSKSIEFTGKIAHGRLCGILSHASALLVDTEKDNNMIAIPEALACATPVITTAVPYNSAAVAKNDLGIVKNDWSAGDMRTVVNGLSKYVSACIKYRASLSADSKAGEFISVFENELKKQ